MDKFLKYQDLIASIQLSTQKPHFDLLWSKIAKKSTVKQFIEKCYLLNLVNFSPTFCTRLYLKEHIFTKPQKSCGKHCCISAIQDGHFRGCSWMGRGAKKAPLSNICHTYPAVMKLGTVIPYLKKIQKIYESRDTPLEFCWHQHFFTGNQQILLYQEIQI